MPELLKQFSLIQKFLLFFTKKLRLSNPWNFKAPFLISVPYFVLLLGGYKDHQSLWAILASICIIIGIAGIGYLTNDLGDKEKDNLIKKENVTSELSVAAIVFLFALFLALAIGPWFYLPMNTLSYGLLGAQFVFFYIYAFPPFRFKERGFLGVLTDSLYAHTNPAVLAALTFFLFAGKTFDGFVLFVILLGVWQFVLGLRNILFHQLKDYENDINSGTKTFATVFSKGKTIFVTTKVMLPLEVISFLLFSSFVTWLVPVFLPAIILFWLFMALAVRKRKQEMSFREYAYFFLDDLYIKWIPLMVLTCLCVRSVQFIPVLVLHFIIFRSEIKSRMIALFNSIVK